MLQLLLSIVSYGAFLLLLMPATVYCMIGTTLLFLLGTGLLCVKKIRNRISISFRARQYHLIFLSIFTAAHCGLSFYNRWSPSSMVQALCASLHMSSDTLLLIAASVLAVLSFHFLYAIFQIIADKYAGFIERHTWFSGLLSGLIAAVTTVILTQFMTETSVVSIGFPNLFFSILIVLVTILLPYCLIGRIIPSIGIGTSIFMIISTINVYVYKFRGRLFEPIDILSAGTVMNVTENYRLFPVPLTIIFEWGMLIALVTTLFLLHRKRKPRLSIKKQLALLAACAIGFLSICYYVPKLPLYQYKKLGASCNGYILDFLVKFRNTVVPQPERYDVEQINALAAQYAQDEPEADSTSTDRPHIIAIMSESFSDLQVVSDFDTNQEVTPFISSLKENTVSGYALASIYGGNTSNSEYEFLTGNSMAWLSPNSTPYQQYVSSSTYSMVSYLKSGFDYKAIAMHPFESSGWSRPYVYQKLGFEKAYFMEDFPQKDYVRLYISDREMFDFLIDTYEAQKENPLFLFGVSMQNHGGYTYTGENYTKHISINGHENEFPDVEQYLSIIHETDRAVERLITYFQNVDEEVVILFFGDHQPQIDEAFYKMTDQTDEIPLDEQQLLYKVPFFIWTNYDIEEKYVECTSLNYLSSYVFDIAGIPAPPYNRFLKDMEKYIPSINAYGYYSVEKGCYLPFTEASGEERSWLETYQAMQYNSLFDEKNQNDYFFP